LKRKFFVIVLTIIFGFIPCFSFPSFKIWILGWIGFVPLLFLFDEKHTTKNFIIGIFAGFIFHIFLLNWLFSVAGFFYILIAIYLSLYWAVFFCLVFAFPEKTRIILGASLWYFLEILMQNLLTGFPWLPLSLSQWSCPATARIASVYGSAGLSGLIMGTNIAFYNGIKNRRVFQSFVIIAVVMFSYLISIYTGISDNSSTTIKIASIQGNSGYFGQSPEESFEIYRNMTNSIKEKCNLVIWPESSYPSILNKNPNVVDYLTQKSYIFPILVGSLSQDNDTVYNSAYLFTRGSVFRYDKKHLVPFGEYVPGKRFRTIENLYTRFAGFMPDISPGNKPGIFSIDSKKFLVLICFENIFPSITTASIDNDTGFIVVITNDSWYGNSFGPFQHFAHNVLRACETGRCVVQTAGTGITGIVSPYGDCKILEKNRKNLFIDGIMISDISLSNVKTVYMFLQEIGIAIIFILLIGVVICKN